MNGTYVKGRICKIKGAAEETPPEAHCLPVKVISGCNYLWVQPWQPCSEARLSLYLRSRGSHRGHQDWSQLGSAAWTLLGTRLEPVTARDTDGGLFDNTAQRQLTRLQQRLRLDRRCSRGARVGIFFASYLANWWVFDMIWYFLVMFLVFEFLVLCLCLVLRL